MSKFELNRLVRKNILGLKPYSSARDEYTGKEGVFLDANENPFGEHNRYPDPHQKELKKLINQLKSVNENNIFIGNGSDEIIDLTYRIFCNPGIDKAIILTPTYGMYEVSAEINDIKIIKVSLNDKFQIDFNSLENYFTDDTIKLLFICSPNNPTGNNIKNIENIIEKFQGIVFVDEAYNDFSNSTSLIDKINEYPNLIVSQTFSKAWALAAVRIGVAYSNSDIISLLNKVKPPYNVSTLNQNAVVESLLNYSEFAKRKNSILEQKEWLIMQFSLIKSIIKIYPSDANFVLIETVNATKLYNELINKKIITRNRNNLIKNCIRITVGSQSENEKLIIALKELTV